jgi:hypothetical protein
MSDGIDRLNLFLSHLNAGDLSTEELLKLKAEAFEACAVDAREWGDDRHAGRLEEAGRRTRTALVRLACCCDWDWDGTEPGEDIPWAPCGGCPEHGDDDGQNIPARCSEHVRQEREQAEGPSDAERLDWARQDEREVVSHG